MCHVEEEGFSKEILYHPENEVRESKPFTMNKHEREQLQQ